MVDAPSIELCEERCVPIRVFVKGRYLNFGTFLAGLEQPNEVFPSEIPRRLMSEILSRPFQD